MNLLKADILATSGSSINSNIRILLLGCWYFLSSDGFREVLFYRIRYFFRTVFILRYILGFLKSWLSKIDIPSSVKIGPGLVIPHPYDIVLTSNCKLGSRVLILQGVTIGVKFGENRNGRILCEIGDNVTICAGAKIIGSVTIGNKVIIGANAVVVTDIPDNSVVAGIPARVIGTYDEHVLNATRFFSLPPDGVLQ